ncbi:MAG: hypothetical protein HZT39_09660 [Pseudoxanthomonas sp.]|nr:MAG: hypothetical protein HZT39_09660 [Pseudoxanthomonas sp.]
MTRQQERRERIAHALFFVIGIAGLCLGAYAKQHDNPSMHATSSAARG